MTRSQQDSSGARSVAAGLRATFTTFVCLLVVLGTVGVLGVLVNGHTHEVEARASRLRQANTGILLALTNAETGVRGYRLSRNPVFLEPYQLGGAEFRVQVAAATAASTTSDQRALVGRQVELAEEWFSSYAVPVASAAPTEVSVTPAQTTASKALFDRIRVVNARLDDVAADRLDEASRRDEVVRRGAVTLALLTLGVALASSLRTYRRTRRALVAPLAAVVDVLENLTAGERGARAEVSQGPEEVREVARSVNHLAEESKRLHQQQAETARLARAATDIGRSIRDHLDAAASVREAVSRLGEELDLDGAYVRLILGEGDQGLGQVQDEWCREGRPSVLSRTEDLTGSEAVTAQVRRLYAGDEIFQAPDLTVAADENPAIAAFAARTGATSLAVVPVGAGDRALGTLCLFVTSGSRELSPGEVWLVRAVAADLGRALVLAGLYRDQQQLVAKLRGLDQAKTDFVSTISHELRTPLTSISGYVEMIREGDTGEVSEQTDAMLAVVERNTVRLRSLIEDLLTLSRIESGTFRTSRVHIRLADVIELAAEALRPAALKGDVTLATVYSRWDEPVVTGDAGQLERVLINLLSNAVKFTPVGGQVEVGTRTEGQWAVVEVTDSGIGIPLAEQGHLFSRFFRASNATVAAIPGTGLGLTIVRSIVENHGGELTVCSTEGTGTTMTVRLPLHQVAAAADSSGSPEVPAQVGTGAGAAQGRR